MVKITPYKNQKYEKLKKEALKSGELFFDATFPPNGTSLFYSRKASDSIEWKRPGELSQNPHLFVDGADAKDFKQGQLGNCWFVAACACIAENPKLWKKIVPNYEKQEWSKDNQYAGIFHFHFYRQGQWLDVVIDDLLPTKGGQLMYTCSNTPDEFWSALLEKAYAKLFGDYESLTAGKGKDALVDMLGGVGQSIDLKNHPTEDDKQSELFEQVLEAFEHDSQMTASISAKDAEVEAKLPTGLIKGHAYSVTDVRRMRQGKGIVAFFKNEKLDMIKLRNPWGQAEWNGAWSDNAPQWKTVSDRERKDSGLVTRDDGEFWMSFSDFLDNFTSVDICHMINTSVFSMSKTWHQSALGGVWLKPMRAGGCANHDSFLSNPQYTIDVKEPTDEVIFSLEQEDQRMNRNVGKENATIGMTILKADLNRTYRMHDSLERVAVSEFSNSRSVFHRMTLPRGRYLVVPSTFDPGFEASYWLRLYCGTNLNLTELKLDAPKVGGCCGPKFKVATQVIINKAVGLGKGNEKKVDAYCVLKCDGTEVKTPVVKDTHDPVWKWRVVLYRDTRKTDIIVEVWAQNTFSDDFLGRAVIDESNTKLKPNEMTAFPLMGKGKEAGTHKKGKLSLQYQHFEDLEDA